MVAVVFSQPRGFLAARSGRRGRAGRATAGFTLLEIVIVLVLAVLLAGGAIALMRVSDSERKMRRMAGEIEVMAKRARAVALLQQTPYALEFTEGVIRMMPLAEVGVESDELPPQVAEALAADAPGGARQSNPVHRQLRIGDGMRVDVRRWGSANFVPIEGERTRLVWRFDPNGLCEPMTVRLVLGDNWIEDEYHPLTAAVRDSAMSMR